MLLHIIVTLSLIKSFNEQNNTLNGKKIYDYVHILEDDNVLIKFPILSFFIALMISCW